MKTFTAITLTASLFVGVVAANAQSLSRQDARMAGVNARMTDVITNAPHEPQCIVSRMLVPTLGGQLAWKSVADCQLD